MKQMHIPPKWQWLRSMIVGIDQQVPILGGKSLPYVNLDNAASTPVLREVLNTVNRFMDWYSSVHRSKGSKARFRLTPTRKRAASSRTLSERSGLCRGLVLLV